MGRFLRVFLVTGVPFGLVAAFLTAAGPHRSWLDFALTAVASGTIFGCVLGVLAWFLTRKSRPSFLAFIGLWFVFSVAGIIAGVGIYVVGKDLPHGRWERVADPPERVVEFAGPICYELSHQAIYAKTASGRFYVYNYPMSGQCYWEEVEGTAADTGRCTVLQRRPYRPPRPPGAAVASAEVYDLGADCAGQRNYVLLEDGSIWQWDRGMCALAVAFIYFLLVAVSIALGLLGCFSLIILRRRGGWQTRHSCSGEPSS